MIDVLQGWIIIVLGRCRTCRVYSIELEKILIFIYLCSYDCLSHRMNNCIGCANHKHFLLFLIYVWTASAYALIVFSINYFFCSSEECTFSPVLVHLVRLMTFLCVGALLFTTNMLMNEIQGRPTINTSPLSYIGSLYVSFFV